MSAGNSPYAPHELSRTDKASALIDALREADAVVVARPGYHGALALWVVLSGLYLWL